MKVRRYIFFAVTVLFTTKPLSASDLAGKNYMLSIKVGKAFPITRAKTAYVLDDELFTKERIHSSPIYSLSFRKRVISNLFLSIEYSYSFNHKISRMSFIERDFVPLTYRTSVLSRVITDSFFVNSSYQFNEFNKSLIPYIIAGVGISHNKTRSFNMNWITTSSLIGGSANILGKTKNNFAWQIGCGLILPINKFLSFDLSYIFRDLGKFKSSSIQIFNGKPEALPSPFIEGRIKTSNLLAGVNIAF